MNAYISNDLNMIKELDPMRHELALLQADWLEKGGTIEVLAGPSFQPLPKRHEPPPRKKVAQPQQKPAEPWFDKFARREIEREERAKARAAEKQAEIDRIREIAAKSTMAEAVERTGMNRGTLFRIAKKGGFNFIPVSSADYKNFRSRTPDDAKDAKDAERILAFKELGLTRNQAREKVGSTYRNFIRLLDKFNIDYPKAFSKPAFFPKAPKQ
ncbi:hypothetical protein [Pseudomonas sp. SDO52101_S400]